MREIKFRAWDIEYEKMAEVLEMDFNNNNYNISPAHVSNYSDEMIILMQYTGLKDKYKKEIYDQDFIEEGLVFWHTTYLGFYVKFFESGFEEDIRPLYDITLPEIIGNIHEDSNLLDNKETKS